MVEAKPTNNVWKNHLFRQLLLMFNNLPFLTTYIASITCSAAAAQNLNNDMIRLKKRKLKTIKYLNNYNYINIGTILWFVLKFWEKLPNVPKLSKGIRYGT